MFIVRTPIRACSAAAFDDQHILAFGSARMCEGSPPGPTADDDGVKFNLHRCR
jgi:hypothetical protein